MTMDYKPHAFWQNMKEKHKNIIEAADETDAAFEFLQGMFEYEGFPDTVRTEFLEMYFLGNGMASIRKDEKGDGEYVAMLCETGATPDAYGLGEKLFSRTANGHVYEDEKDSDVVAYGWNNLSKTPCTDAYRIGSYIAEIDTSLDLLVWWSRASRLFLAEDNKQKAMLEEAFAALKKGTPLTIKSENLLREIENGKKGIEALDLTDTDFADKLDKLAFIRECRFKWFKERYGMDTRSTGKMAQVSVDEANGDIAMAFVFPLNMLKARRAFCEMCNKKFGWNCSVHFAGAWLGEMERYEDTVVENGNLDIDGYDAIIKEEDNTTQKGDNEDGKGTETQGHGEEAQQDNEQVGSDEGGSQDKDGSDEPDDEKADE
jgi:hypothetical protein